MSKNLLRVCAVFALITAIGCGDDEKSNNSNNTTPTDMNTTTDMPATDMNTMTDMGDMDVTEPDMEPDMQEEAAARCTDTPKPERCNEDPATFDQWQPASVISKLVITDGSCCFDYDGNGVPDNGLGGLLTELGPSLGIDVNPTIAASIADGTIAVVLEHDGLTSTDAGSTFAMNFLLADPADPADPAPKAAGANHYTINPASFEAGVWPQARAEGATIGAGGAVAAGPGRIVLRLDLLGIQLDLIISQARIEGLIDAANSDLATKGVAIADGAKLGGVVRAADLFDAINSFQSTQCDCLGYSGGTAGPLVQYDPADPSTASCDANFTVGTCDENDEVQSVCKTLVEDACGYLTAISIAFDVRADGQACLEGTNPPPCDSVSIGANFAAAGAIIDGVSAE